MNSKELAKNFLIPIKCDSVLSPKVYYGDPVTGIYFITDDDQYGRITFENLDSLKISRGEYMPFQDDWKTGQPYMWASKVENSKWLKERYAYEKKYYGRSYEWGGDVGEMLTDFSHYIFSFHDEFVEVIARGFWYEKDKKSLMGRNLLPGHPALDLPQTKMAKFSAYGLMCQVRVNPKKTKDLIRDAAYCSQSIMEFAVEFKGKAKVDYTLGLSYRNGKLVSILRGFFGAPKATFKGVASLKDVRPHIESHMKEIAERRKAMSK